MKITALYFYPVKSLAGIRVDTLPLEPAGPRHDREWMVVNEGGKFITQRELPPMQLIQPRIDSGAMILTAAGRSVRVALEGPSRGPRRVEVWGKKVEALDEGDEAANFLQQALGLPLRLVRLAKAGRQEEAGGLRYDVRFADACPILLCAEESLADLNARAGQTLSIARFRPNIVVSGAAPFAEDGWAGFSINDSYFSRIRACTRCSVTGVDPDTAARGPEPLKTLAKFRKNGTKLEFGQYFFTPAAGALRVGDPITPA